MPEYIRALIVILGLASVVFYFAKAPATAVAMATEDFVRRRNTWFFITLAGFLSQSFWVFVLVTVVVLSVSAKNEKNKVALWSFLILAIPLVKVEIPGFAGIRYLIDIDYLRILNLVLLLPVAMEFRRIAVNNKSKPLLPDIILTIYIIYNIMLVSRAGDIVAMSRSSIYWMLDVALPYYAISRSVRDIKAFREVLMSLIVASMVSALIAVFEFSRTWMLYDSFGDALSLNWTTGYLARGDFVRAVSSSSQAIVLGYVVAIAISLYLYFYNLVGSKAIYLLGLALLIAGEIAPLSKGPWVGLGLAIFIFVATGPAAARNVAKFVVLSVPAGLFLLLTDSGSEIAQYLPFVGGLDEGSVSYRTNLIAVSMNAIDDNPIFGSPNFLAQMEEARNGAGLIDLVNHYIGVTLYSGFVGLALFVGFFATILYKLFKRLGLKNSIDVENLMGRSLFSALLAALFMISAVSSIYHVPIFYYMLAALSVGYLNMQLKSGVAHDFKSGTH